MNEDFVGREGLASELWTRLADRSLLLLGPRRVGKTRMLEEMAARPRHDHVLHVVDLQGQDSVDGLVRCVAAKLPPTPIAGLTRRVERVDVAGVGVGLGAAPATDPWDELRDLLERCAQADQLVIVALDEVPWWLDAVDRSTPGAARTALAQLRRLRHDRRLEQIRWIFTGSVGIASPAIAWGATEEINDLDVVEVPPLERPAGTALFETTCLAAGRSADPAACGVAHEIAGGYPHWIRVLAERARSRGSPVSQEIVLGEVERLIGTRSRFMLQDEGDAHFERRYSDADHEIARLVLRTVARSDAPMPRRGVVTAVLAEWGPRERGRIETVLARLVDDFYLCDEDADYVRFALPLLRRWVERWG